MKRISPFNKKLLHYSTLATSMLTLSTKKSEAQIIYTDVNPDSVLNWADGSHWYYKLDLNNDGIADFLFQGGYPINTCDHGIDIVALGNNNSVLLANPSAFQERSVIPLSSGDIISGSDTLVNYFQVGWKNFGTFQQFNYTYTYASGGVCWTLGFTGLWFDVSDKYVGLRFKLGSQIYYGWARLSISFAQLTVKDYAYESVPFVPIIAGQAYPTQVNSSSTASPFIAAANQNQLIIEFSPELIGGKIFLEDELGNLRQQLNAVSTTTIINTKDFPSGVYFIKIEKEGKQWVKKVLIQ